RALNITSRITPSPCPWPRTAFTRRPIILPTLVTLWICMSRPFAKSGHIATNWPGCRCDGRSATAHLESLYSFHLPATQTFETSKQETPNGHSEHNRREWDQRVAEGNRWTTAVGPRLL